MNLEKENKVQAIKLIELDSVIYNKIDEYDIFKDMRQKITDVDSSHKLVEN